MKRSTRWCDASAAAGHLDCLMYARAAMGLKWGTNTCRAAARGGHTACLAYVHQSGCPCDRKAIRIAAVMGRVGCFDYLCGQSDALSRIVAIHAAARNGRTHVLESAADKGILILDAHLWVETIIGGDLDALVWTCDRGAAPGAKCLDMAIRRGHLDIVRYLCGRGVRPRLADPIESAVCSGNSALVRYLHETEGFALSPSGMYRAAERRRLDIVLYIREHGCAWHPFVMKRALEHGWMSVVRSMCETPDCVHASAPFWAIRYDRADELGFILDTGVGARENLVSDAATLGRARLLPVLEAHGFDWSYGAIAAAACGGHIAVLKYALSVGAPWNSAACDDAAAHGHLDALRFLHENGCPWDYFTRTQAKAFGHKEILCYLDEHGCP